MLEGKLSVFFINFETGLSDNPVDRNTMDQMRSIRRTLDFAIGRSRVARGELGNLFSTMIQIHHLSNALRDRIVKKRKPNLL